MTKKLLIHAWWLEEDNDGYHIPATHYIYLAEIVKYYKDICLLAPVKQLPAGSKSTLELIELPGISVYQLPFSAGYVAAVKNFGHYVKAYKKLCKVYQCVYVRYPSPFGWLSRYYFKNIIIHFVGDPVDATLANPNFSKLKRKLLVSLFMPENYLFMQACKKAKVFTNGYHIKSRLLKRGIQATAVISSTLEEKDFYFAAGNRPAPENIKMLYTGYLRRAKGVETLIKALAVVVKQYPLASFTIVGTGEFETELKTLAAGLNLESNMHFTGHIDSRAQLNQLYRTHNVFCFASLSEGSPRVILEAMANGLNVVSTPVGVLPNLFEDDKHLLFAQTGNPDSFAGKIAALVHNAEKTENIRKAAFAKVKDYTVAGFIKTIFTS